MDQKKPITIDEIRTGLEIERQTLMQRLAHLNKVLGYGPRELATCPNCRKQYNKKVVDRADSELLGER